MFGFGNFKTLAAAAVLMMAAGGASAATVATVSCPGDRVFSVTTAPGSTCFATGVGNINGNPDLTKKNPDPLYPLLLAAFGAGHVLIDKSDDAKSGLKPNALVGALESGLSGSWSFTLPSAGAGFSWTNVILAFKAGSGGKKLNPDWAAFVIPNSVISGTWAFSGKQALSHVNLYAQSVPAPIPLPAAGFLLLGALGGLAVLRRRRREA